MAMPSAMLRYARSPSNCRGVSTVRIDVVALRLGGEEFAVLIRDCAVTVAMQRAEVFREQLAGRPLPIAGLALG